MYDPKPYTDHVAYEADDPKNPGWRDRLTDAAEDER